MDENKANEINSQLISLDKKRQKCFGYARLKNDIVVFAINGAPERKVSKLLIDKIRDIFGNNAIQAKDEDSFTIFPLIQIYSNSENFITERLVDKAPFNSGFYIHNSSLKWFLYFNEYLLKIGYASRIFSCVERKILGRIKFEDSIIYVSKQPCYLCLNCIIKACYIKNGDVILIERTSKNLFVNNFIKKLIF